MINIILSKPSRTIMEIRNYSNIPVYIKRKLPYKVNKIIRWGSVREIPDEVEFSKVYNDIHRIRLVSDKLRCRKWLADRDIPVTTLGHDLYPCIGRTRYHHGGNGFWLCQTPYDVDQAKIEGADYFSQYYPKQKEYRVHIGKNIEGEYKVILYSEKVGDKYGSVIWNHDNGFEFEHLDRGERRKDIINLAKDAIETVGLDFGCVDIGSNPLYSQLPPAVVFEINTAPALSPLGIKKYSEYFLKLCGTI